MLGVKNYADGIGRRVIELGFNLAKIVFESAQDSAGQVRSGAAVIFQNEMSGLALAVAFLFLAIAFGFFEGVLNVGILAKRQRTFPFGDGLIDFILAVGRRRRDSEAGRR